jgi:DNA-binding transcriptional ArsR family regulator
MEHLDAFQALSDPTRRRIVEALRAGERPVNDVVAELDIHQSGVSRHLGILLDAGFVRVRPDGQRRLYSLRPEPFRELDGWLASYRKLWHVRLDRFGEALERKKTSRGAGRRKERRRP